jgi:malate dehydrogenase (oxaloacetate-decarboxylating)
MSTYKQAPASDKRDRRATLHDHKPAHLITPIRVALRGAALLSSPRFNKGTGFTEAERAAFSIEGRLPYRSNTLEEQCDRAYEQLEDRKEMLRKNTFLQSLKEQNWTLYYALLSRHLKELVPVIYTPTEVSH